jgi:amidophosphoribosyltransferase
MCGTLGIFSHKPVAQELYNGLIHLQHRGQDACGILTYNEKFHIKRGTGLVRDTFVQDDMDMLKGNMGIAQVRYPTAGSKFSFENAQPLMIFPHGIAMTQW